MALDQFLKDNRLELIARTREKVGLRSSPPVQAIDIERGVPIFLSQLSATLSAGQGQGGGTVQSTLASRDAQPAMGESAAMRGRDLLESGFSIAQVVHEYGDVCQAITELAEKQGAMLTLAEFHTLNRCLDNAIADAVSAWSEERDRIRQASQSDAVLGQLRRLLEQATMALEVVLQGKVGVGGATGKLLARALFEMRALVDKGEAPCA